MKLFIYVLLILLVTACIAMFFNLGRRCGKIQMIKETVNKIPKDLFDKYIQDELSKIAEKQREFYRKTHK